MKLAGVVNDIPIPVAFNPPQARRRIETHRAFLLLNLQNLSTRLKLGGALKQNYLPSLIFFLCLSTRLKLGGALKPSGICRDAWVGTLSTRLKLGGALKPLDL